MALFYSSQVLSKSTGGYITQLKNKKVEPLQVNKYSANKKGAKDFNRHFKRGNPKSQ